MFYLYADKDRRIICLLVSMLKIVNKILIKKYVHNIDIQYYSKKMTLDYYTKYTYPEMKFRPIYGNNKSFLPNRIKGFDNFQNYVCKLSYNCLIKDF